MLLATEAIRPDCVYLTPGYGHLSKGLTTAYGVGRERLGPACHLHRPDQRRPGAQPDICNGKKGIREPT